MNKFYFTQDERALMFRVIDKGMLQKPGRDAPSMVSSAALHWQSPFN